MKCKACPDPSYEPQHTPGDMTCIATRRGFELLREGLRPFPKGHSLPSWLPLQKAATRCPYTGHPREHAELLAKPEPQFWGPRWIDPIVKLWAGPIALDHTGARMAQREAVLQTILTLWPTTMKTKIWECESRDGDLRAVRDYIRHVIKGPMPELIDEVEGRV